MASLLSCCGLFNRSSQRPSPEVQGATRIDALSSGRFPVEPKAAAQGSDVGALPKLVGPGERLEADGEVRDAAILPAAGPGFLRHTAAAQEPLNPRRLPSYRTTSKGLANEFHRTDPSTGCTRVQDTLIALQQDCILARCVLLETARLQQGVFVFGRGAGSVLRHDALRLDWALSEMVLYAKGGLSIYHRQGDFHRAVMDDEKFKASCESAKRTMLRLGKEFRDTILRELQEGMVRKKRVEHGLLVDKSTRLNDEVKEVCERIKEQYFEEVQRLLDAAATR